MTRTHMILATTALTMPARAHAGDQQASGNLTGLYEAEELSPGVLPAQPTWHEREPNSYSDFGGAFAMTTRKPIRRDRQFAKGDVSDNNPTSGYTEDLTPLNMRRKMQGFLFANAREKPSTRPLNGNAVAITAVDTGTKQYRAAAGLDRFKIGHIVLPVGFYSPANNVVTTVTQVAAGAITVSNAALAADAAPAATALLEAVGFQYAAGAVALTLPAGRALLTMPAGVLTHGLNLGEWIGVVGFANGGTPTPFYGRVSNFTDTTIEFDKTTGNLVADNGAGDTVALYFGTVVRNEDDPTLIVRRSYTHERQYGLGAQTSSEGVQGAESNQLTITVPTPGADAKVTVEIAHIARTSYERDIGEGLMTAVGNTIAALNEPCFKPGLDVYRHKLAVIDELTLNPTALVAYSQQASVVINNNLAGNKAIETFGNAGINVGEFSVTGSITAYWTSIAATRRVRQGADCTWDLILTKASVNKAVCFDIASLGLGGARAAVEANTPITLPLDTAAGKGKFGYTLCASFLRYVPTALMSQQSA